MDKHSTPSNPTIDDIEVYLVAHNGWSTSEFAEFVEAQAEYINEDGTTLLDRTQWAFLASGHNL
jgi:hypothetical protein